MPKVTIAIPTHNMKDKDFFLKRCLDSIREQSFQDYEIVVTNKGKMAENTNRALKQAKGELIKIMYMDDYFNDKHALKRIVDSFKGNWLVTGCIHESNSEQELFNPHYASYSDDIETGNNTIGSPSVVTIRNGLDIYFDENMSWLLDCDFYKRLNEKYGPPTILNDINVIIGVGNHQTTHILTDSEKLAEHNYIYEKYN